MLCTSCAKFLSIPVVIQAALLSFRRQLNFRNLTVISAQVPDQWANLVFIIRLEKVCSAACWTCSLSFLYDRQEPVPARNLWQESKCIFYWPWPAHSHAVKGAKSLRKYRDTAISQTDSHCPVAEFKSSSSLPCKKGPLPCSSHSTQLQESPLHAAAICYLSGTHSPTSLLLGQFAYYGVRQPTLIIHMLWNAGDPEKIYVKLRITL